jgi:LDH2 family malate/lactate/ureidoglycolate dehydrogenase
MSKKRAQKSQPRYLPTERQKRIAQIARSIGANVNEDDVKKICEATRMELSMRK